MAKLLFTAFLADARNKLNGSVFSKNRYGNYVRTKTTPSNPQTEFQQAGRQDFGAFSSQWRSLTEAQRTAWSQAAADFPVLDAFGNPKTLSGNALFVSLNRNLSVAGQASIESPPLPVAIPSLEIVAFDAALTAGALTTADLEYLAPAVLTAPATIIIKATAGMSPGISFFNNKLRVIGSIAAVAGGDTIDFITDYQARFGNPALGTKIGVEIYAIANATGQSGVPLRATAIVSGT